MYSLEASRGSASEIMVSQRFLLAYHKAEFEDPRFLRGFKSCPQAFQPLSAGRRPVLSQLAPHVMQFINSYPC